jgi:hypothetical protein
MSTSATTQRTGEMVIDLGVHELRDGGYVVEIHFGFGSAGRLIDSITELGAGFEDRETAKAEVARIVAFFTSIGVVVVVAEGADGAE